jgi:hypothetical protein
MKGKNGGAICLKRNDDKRNRGRFAKLAISCCNPTIPRAHTILPTAQPEMTTAILGCGLTHAPYQLQGLDRKNTVIEKNIRV